jgi:ADP-heptose:LPS heptosyltransferase
MRFDPGRTDRRAPRFLVIQRDNIGDLVLSTPFIRALRERFPSARIDALVNSYNAPVLDRNPHVDTVVAYVKWKHRRPGLARFAHQRENWRRFGTLRAARYDVAVILNRDYTRHAVQLALTAAAARIAGFTHGRGLLERFIAIRVPARAIAHQHIAQRAAALLQAIETALDGRPGSARTMPPCELFPDPRLRERLAGELAAAGIPPVGLTIGVQVSARKLDQRWPAERFAELIHRLHRRLACAVLLFWSPGSEDNAFHPGDDAKAAFILERCAGLPVHGIRAAVFAETVAGMSLADAIVTGDGGAMHVAAALGRPIVGLFGATALELWHPWGPRFAALRPPSLDVVDLSVEEVLGATLQLLDECRGAAAPARGAAPTGAVPAC